MGDIVDYEDPKGIELLVGSVLRVTELPKTLQRLRLATLAHSWKDSIIFHSFDLIAS